MQATNLLAIYFAQVFIGDTPERGYHASINLSLSLFLFLSSMYPLKQEEVWKSG